VSFFGDLLKIIAIGAFFVATGPFGLSVTSTLATALRIGGVVLGYLGALIDRPRLLQERQNLFISTTLEPKTPIPVVYGRAKVGAVIADWFIQPDNNFKELYVLAVMAHGSRDDLGVAGVDEIWLDQRRAVNVTTAARYYPYKAITANYKVFLGSNVQNIGATRLFTDGAGLGIEAPADVAGSGWSLTTDTGKGLCVIGFMFVNVDTATFSETGKAITSSSVANPTTITCTAHGFATGESVRITGHSGSTPSLNADWVIIVTGVNTFTIPEIVTVGGTGGSAKRFAEGPIFHGPPSIAAIVRGNRIYDHRTDMWTAGGDNPAMVIRDYLLATVYGCGFSPTLIHEDSFDAAADVCDVLVRYVVGSPVTISNSDAATERVNTSTAHGWATGQLVRISGHTGATPVLNGDHVITVTTSTSFTLNDVPNITVGGTGGTVSKLVEIKRFTCNGVVDTSRATSDTLQELLSSCRGNLVWEQGQFKLTIRSPAVASPTLTLDPSIIIGEWSFRNAGQEEKWNSVTATYIEPANGEFKAQDVQWPLVGTTNAYLAADNDFTNTLQLSLPFTNDQLMAQGIAQVTLNEARLGITASCQCNESALAASVGDRVYVTHPTPGWTLKEFWVTSLQLLPNTTVAVTLQEYDPTAYDLATQEDRRTFPATGLDSIFSVPAPTGVTATALAPQGMLITWVSPNYGHIDYYEVQAKCTSAGDSYVTVATPRAGQALEAVAPLARPGQTWDSRVRVVNVVGWPSEWADANQLVIAVPGTATPGVGSLLLTGYAPSCVPTNSPPDLVSVNRAGSGGDSCAGTGEWIQTVSWTTTGANDVGFQVNIQGAMDSGGASFSDIAIGLTTSSSSFDDHTGVEVKVSASGSIVRTRYRKYRVLIIRKSDGSEIEHLDTSQDTIAEKSGICL
jgi:hypothetical protein